MHRGIERCHTVLGECGQTIGIARGEDLVGIRDGVIRREDLDAHAIHEDVEVDGAVGVGHDLGLPI